MDEGVVVDLSRMRGVRDRLDDRGRRAVCHRVGADATAFAYRDATFATVIAGMWPDPAQNEDDIRWVRESYDATAPHSEAGGYVNFMSEDDQDRVEANDGGNYRRAWSRSSGPTTRTTSSTSTRTSRPSRR